MGQAAENPDITPAFIEPELRVSDENPQSISDEAKLAVSGIVKQSPEGYGWQAPTHGNVELNPDARAALFRRPNLLKRSISNMVTGHDLSSHNARPKD